MRLRLSRALRWSTAAAVLFTGCSGGSVLDPDPDAGFDGGSALAAVGALEEMCATIDFESYAHGDEITVVTVPELDLAFELTVWPANSGLSSARAYSTDTMSPPGDPFLAWAGSASACPECLGRGNVLVVEDGAGFSSGGASDFGGTFFLDQFTRPDVKLRQVTAVSAASFEASHQLWVDAEPLASSVVADGPVQTLVPASEPTITSFVELVILSSARGGFDDLQLCRMMEIVDVPDESEQGGEGCPVSFWKDGGQQEAWNGTGIGPGTPMADLFGSLPVELARPEQQLSPTDLSLEQALRLRGAGVNKLLRETAAAYLNAASGDVSFDLTTGDVETLLASAANGGDVKNTTKTFAGFNHQVCPLD